MKKYGWIALVAGFVFAKPATAQLPFELFAGHEKATADLMFFRFFKKAGGAPSRFLFFNRNRVSVDYRMTTTAYLPQFGFTGALSYNPPAWKGLAPVVVGQVFGSGVFPKAGVQYARSGKQATVFGWLVCETLHTPTLDLFFMARYTPQLGEKWNLFFQIELVNNFPTDGTSRYNFTQRLRLGLKRNAWQFGLGADTNQQGRDAFVRTNNAGIFLRQEF